VPEIRQIETAQQSRTLLLAQQSRHYFRLAFRYNSADDYISSGHVLIGTMTEVCPYCKALKFRGQTKGMCCASGKITLPKLAEPQQAMRH
jgi:hypothetical protein